MIVRNEWCLPVRNVSEGCPSCAEDIAIKSDGSSTCLLCGHEEVRPCSICPRLQEGTCNFSQATGCSEFPETFGHMLEQVLRLFPDAEVLEDSDGQLIIYTDFKEDEGSGALIPHQLEEEQGEKYA